MFINTKKKNNILGLSITAALLISSSAVLAASDPDVDMKGDSLITLPKHGSTVDVASVDVWFDKVDNALGYTVDLFRSNTTADSTTLAVDCSAAVVADFEDSLFLPATGLDCGQESEASKPGDGKKSGVYICKWTTPVLANGNYAIAINPIHVGDQISGTEKRGTCGNDGASRSNVAVDFDTTSNEDRNYQTFTVDVQHPNAGTTQKPSKPEPFLPAAESSLGGGNLTFTDSSPEAGKATWYQLWIYDKDNNRVDLTGDNPSHDNWYKLTVDANVSCTENANAAGDRVCDISNVGGTSAISSASANDLFTWWVMGWNNKGYSGWSTAPAKFKK